MVVLATKVYVAGEARERARTALESMVDDAIGALDVRWTVGIRDDDFPSVTVEGADAVAARNVLREEWGAVRATSEPGTVRWGTLEAWDEDGVVFDAGGPVHIPAAGLGLGPGTPSQIRQRFGLVQHLRMQFVTPGGEEDVGGESARLADAERDRLYEWTRGPGRVNVNSATRAEVRATVNRAGHGGDIATVERLGLLEQSIVCREGTDPPGLLASIGEYLPAELLCVVP